MASRKKPDPKLSRPKSDASQINTYDQGCDEWYSIGDSEYLLDETLKRLGFEQNAEIVLVRALVAGNLTARAKKHELGFWNSVHIYPLGEEVPKLFWYVWERCPRNLRVFGDPSIVWFSDEGRSVFEGITEVEINKRGFDEFRNRIGGGGSGGRPRSHEPVRAATAITLRLILLTDSQLERETGSSVGSSIAEWYNEQKMRPPSESSLDTQGSEILGEFRKNRSK
jgi:hypothetical protein